MRTDMRLAGTIVQLKNFVPFALCLFGVSGELPGQELQIVSPADGSVVHSGQMLKVELEANHSLFQSVVVGACAGISPTPPLTAPPYQFTVQIPSEQSSGGCSISAIGSPTSGQDLVIDTISVDIERADLPQTVRVNEPTMFFEYAGTTMRNEFIGVFADGSRVRLTNSTYLTYSSDTPSVATVDEQGDVLAIAPGAATMTVTYGNALIGTTALQVPLKVPYPVTVNPSTISLYTSQTEQFTAALAIDPSLDQSVTWSVNPELGDIDNRGLYTAPSSAGAPRNITVTAISKADPNKRGSAHIWILPRSENR